MLSNLQKRTAQAIVNIFETGSPWGDYGSVTVSRGDAGHLTYGRAQTTLASGNLHRLIRSYCESPGARCAGPLSAYLERLERCDLSLDTETVLHDHLREAGRDLTMRCLQDRFFDEHFWVPACAAASSLGLSTALAASVVYDSFIHGSWARMRDETNRLGRPETLGERRWVGNYVNTRRRWLAGHRNPILRLTTYRMDCFVDLTKKANWTLALPLRVRGFELTRELLEGDPPEPVRTLRLANPPMAGADVRGMQEALNRLRVPCNVSGVFDRDTAAAVKRFQKSRGLSADGVVGAATRAALKVAA